MSSAFLLFFACSPHVVAGYLLLFLYLLFNVFFDVSVKTYVCPMSLTHMYA